MALAVPMKSRRTFCVTMFPQMSLRFSCQHLESNGEIGVCPPYARSKPPYEPPPKNREPNQRRTDPPRIGAKKIEGILGAHTPGRRLERLLCRPLAAWKPARKSCSLTKLAGSCRQLIHPPVRFRCRVRSFPSVFLFVIRLDDDVPMSSTGPSVRTASTTSSIVDRLHYTKGYRRRASFSTFH